MRYFGYFLLTFALCVLAVVAIAGRRGGISRQPPLYVFPDMDRQLKLRPQNGNGFVSTKFVLPAMRPVFTGESSNG